MAFCPQASEKQANDNQAQILQNLVFLCSRHRGIKSASEKCSVNTFFQMFIDIHITDSI